MAGYMEKVAVTGKQTKDVHAQDKAVKNAQLDTDVSTASQIDPELLKEILGQGAALTAGGGAGALYDILTKGDVGWQSPLIGGLGTSAAYNLYKNKDVLANLLAAKSQAAAEGRLLDEKNLAFLKKKKADAKQAKNDLNGLGFQTALNSGR